MILGPLVSPSIQLEILADPGSLTFVVPRNPWPNWSIHFTDNIRPAIASLYGGEIPKTLPVSVYCRCMTSDQESGLPSVSTLIISDDPEAIVVGRVIFYYPYNELSIRRWQICGAFFNPNGILSHSNRPDCVINAGLWLVPSSLPRKTHSPYPRNSTIWLYSYPVTSRWSKAWGIPSVLSTNSLVYSI